MYNFVYKTWVHVIKKKVFECSWMYKKGVIL